MTKHITAEYLRTQKAAGIPISGLTAYDWPTAVMVDGSGVDVILVGDSLGQLMLGRSRIEETTLDDMIHHCNAVSRGTQRALLVGDMPFGSYEVDPVAGVHNAVRLIKEGGVDAVKVEGGLEVVPVVAALTAARIACFGHLTLRHIPSALRTQEAQTAALGNAARALEDAGACAVVLVGIPAEMAAHATRGLREIPTIGYRSGGECDGQLFVTPVLLGLLPKTGEEAGPYASIGDSIREALAHFCADVRSGHGPQAVTTPAREGSVS